MMDSMEHFEQLYGELNLAPQDAAKWVFASGWNSALTELLRQVGGLPLDKDTRACMAVQISQMMHVNPADIQRTMQ
jgi:hypothetical protein